MLAAKSLGGVASEVNLRECISPIPKLSTNKAAHSGFETQRRHHQKSKTGISVAPQKGLMSSKLFFTKIEFELNSILNSSPLTVQGTEWPIVKFSF